MGWAAREHNCPAAMEGTSQNENKSSVLGHLSARVWKIIKPIQSARSPIQHQFSLYLSLMGQLRESRESRRQEGRRLIY